MFEITRTAETHSGWLVRYRPVYAPVRGQAEGYYEAPTAAEAEALARYEGRKVITGRTIRFTPLIVTTAVNVVRIFND